MGALKDKVVIVTGASSGIGRSTAVALAAEVVASARREAQGRELVAAVKDRGGEITWVTADMRVEGDVEALVKAAVSTYGRLDAGASTIPRDAPSPRRSTP
ncbi:SDR family NAD(P)-dependent oxidoreductase [Sorangium sp. So ce367]|uniref:SDR family NAD(P)-dependent oxidoreductase n=1 Tax=Sorangium sp. So ce367 TaxID=3133305 RepID=UPI003F64382E